MAKRTRAEEADIVWPVLSITVLWAIGLLLFAPLLTSWYALIPIGVAVAVGAVRARFRDRVSGLWWAGGVLAGLGVLVWAFFLIGFHLV